MQLYVMLTSIVRIAVQRLTFENVNHNFNEMTIYKLNFSNKRLSTLMKIVFS